MAGCLTALMVALIALISQSVARAQSCAPVTKCELISTTGNYCVPADTLLTSTGGDCLVIAAPNVSLNLEDQANFTGSINGAGTGAGIRVMTRATSFSLRIGSCWAINNFNVGIEDDGAAAPSLNSPSILCAPLIANVNYGIDFYEVIGGHYSGSADISANVEGVLINGGSQNYIAGAYKTLPPPASGVEPIMRILEGRNGVHIRNSEHNTVLAIQVESASTQGIFIDGSSGNIVSQNQILGDDITLIGIRANSSSVDNFILQNSAAMDTYYDLFQGTTATTVGCNGNVWSDNHFGTANQSCIQ